MPDHPTEQVDRVVEALVNADKPAWRDTLAWYRAMACAALDAATPAQEWKVVHQSGGGQIFRTYDEARQHFDNFVERPPGVEDPGSGRYTHIALREVSPWRRVGSVGERDQ